MVSGCTKEIMGSTIIARASAIFLSKPSQLSSNQKSTPFFIPKLQRPIFPKSRFRAFAEGGNGNRGKVSSDERPKFNLRWRDLLDPNPENIVAIGLTGLLTWASLQVLWQIFFISGAILLAALKYSFIAALILFILITLL